MFKDFINGTVKREEQLASETRFMAYDKNHNFKDSVVKLDSGKIVDAHYIYGGEVSMKYEVPKMKEQICRAINNYLSLNGTEDFDNNMLSNYVAITLNASDLKIKIQIKKIEKYLEINNGRFLMKTKRDTVYCPANCLDR